MRNSLLRLGVALPTLFAAVLFSAATARAEQPQTADLSKALEEYNAGARFPLPQLSSADLRRLSRGGVVRIRDKGSEGGPQRTTGLLLCDARRDDLWIAFRDTHLISLDELTEVRLSKDGQWPSLWYQFFHVRGPFADRHWVIEVDDNIELARASADRSWEHYWTLAEGGPELGSQAVAAGRIPRVDETLAAKAVYVPVNEGAWLLISLGDGRTVLGYTVRASVGGHIPDKLVESYSMATLARVLRRVKVRSALVPEHYNSEHPRIRGGDGEPIP